jgi:hypothetical protein
MIRAALIVSVLSSVFIFPWPFTVLLALLSAPFVPLLPLLAGLLTDMLFYVSQAGTLPLFTLCGFAATMLAFFVRGRLTTGTMRA